jgi:flagellar hook-basal body protein
MGLASAMSTALTGLSAAETTVDVVGNNLANSSTVGFKQSQVQFETQFLQTLSIGAAPSATNGGTDPQQLGLGTMVASISPNFSQGTIETSSNPTDLAIQGDGFFIVQGSTGQQLYTRDGQLQTNAQNQLVTTNGNLLMGYGVDNQFNINTSQLQPLQIPLGTAMVAKATQNVTLQGALTPTGDIANQATILQTGPLTDNSLSYPSSGPTVSLDGTGQLSGQYQYYVTFTNGNVQSRPQLVATTSPLLSDNQVELSNIPTIPSGDTSGWTGRDIYRSVQTAGNTNYYLVATLPNATDASATVVDNSSDAQLEAGGQTLNMNGPAANSQTLLSNLYRYDGTTYNPVFPDTGTLQFTGSLGGTTLQTKNLQITGSTTLGELATFLQQALGIQTTSSDPSNPIPNDSGSGLPPGASITTNGCLQLVGNNGTGNAISIGLASLSLTTNGATPQQESIDLPFNTTQNAVGQSASTDVVVYDSLGMPLSVHITAVLQAETSSYTQYRWFADCGNNDPGPGSAEIAVGTGVVDFDGQGNLMSTSNSQVSIGRYSEPSVKPLEFNLNFANVSGLAATGSSLSVSSQDGSAPGVLSSFTIGTDGTISGVFSNGITQNLGQIQLARFSNPTGLEQQGQNLYTATVNSGLPIQNSPGEQGMGSIVSGAIEQSNTDVGSNLIDLILASTMYEGNTRVITTVQNLYNALLSLNAPP